MKAQGNYISGHIHIVCNGSFHSLHEQNYEASHTESPSLPLPSFRPPPFPSFYASSPLSPAPPSLPPPATIPRGIYHSSVISSCPTASGRQDTRDDISREVVQLLVEEFAVRPYGRLRAFPANSCQEISHAHPNIGAGLYWISQDGGEPIQMYCNI